MNGNIDERAKIEFLDSFFKRFGEEFKKAFGEIKRFEVSEYEWGDWYYFSLSNARTNEVLQLPREANCIVRVELVGSATIKFDSPNGREVDLVKTRRLKGFTFKRIYISNDAVSGGHLLLLVGKGDFDIEIEKALPGQCDLQPVDDGNYLDIKPPSGETWEIAVIIHGGDCEIYFSDGTNEQLFNTGTGADHIKDCGYIVTNSHYVRVKNVSGSTALFGYMAVRIYSSS